MSTESKELTLEDLIIFTEDDEITPNQLKEIPPSEEPSDNLEDSKEENSSEDSDEPIEDSSEDPLEDSEEKDPIEDPIEESIEDTDPIELTEDQTKIQSYYDLQKSSGYLILPDDYEFTPTPEGLEKAFQDSHKNLTQEVFKSIWSTMDPEAQSFLRYKMTTGGTFDSFVKEYSVSDLNTVDTTNPNSQKSLVRQYLKETTRYSQDKIDKELARYEASGDLESEAEEALAQLKTLRETKREEELQKIEQQKNQFRKSTSSAIKESNIIPSQEKPKINAFMHNEVTREDGVMTDLQRKVSEIIQSPEDYVTLAYLLYDHKTGEGFNFDRWGKLNKTKGVTTFQKNLESALDTRSKISKSSSSSKPKKTKEVNLSEFIELFD